MSKDNQQCSFFKPNSVVDGCLSTLKATTTSAGDIGASILAIREGSKYLGGNPYVAVAKALGAETGILCAAGAINTMQDNYNTTCANNDSFHQKLIGDAHTLDMYGYWNH